MSKYWKIAAGKAAEGRDYSELFFKYGMAFVGEPPKKNIKNMSSVNEGDVVILNKGRNSIIAAGKVVQKKGKHNGSKDKKWLMDFDGWELPAYCYVEWKKSEPPLSTDGLPITTICQLHQEKYKQAANRILETGCPIPNYPEQEPEEPEEIKDNQLLECLIIEGLSPSSACDLTNTIAKIRLLGKYYYANHWGEIREHETRTFLVIPLLLALGWSERQLKIELSCDGGKADIACFRRNYCPDKKDKDCIAIIETKGLHFGLDYAPEQAKKYSKSFPNCKVVIVTNGYCYKIYSIRDSDEIKLALSAYINLLRPTKKYPLDPTIDGALSAIKQLLPNKLTSKTPA